MWWDDSHIWSTAMDGYKIFRRDRGRKRGSGVALYVGDSFDFTEVKDCEEKI